MTDSDIIIHRDLVRFIGERKQLHNEYAESRTWVQELNMLGERVPNEGTVQILSSLTRENTPPAELKASLFKLRQQITDIQKLETELTELQELYNRVITPIPRPMPLPTVAKNDASSKIVLIIGLAAILFILLLIILWPFIHF